jgi:DNA-binding XRE family transcriptional regulator
VRRPSSAPGDSDFLDEVIAERAALNSEFPAMVDAAVETRRLLRDLAHRRRTLRLSQTVVAKRMGTTQSALARMERGDVDPRLSTVQRYVTALGDQLVHQSP